jgi:hypothetical protein
MLLFLLDAAPGVVVMGGKAASPVVSALAAKNRQAARLVPDGLLW